MRKGFGAASLIGILLMAIALTPAASLAAERSYVVGSGPMGGPALVFMGSGVQLFNEAFKGKHSLTSAGGGGSMENMRRMMSGEFDTGLVHLYQMFDAWRGIGLFEGQKPFKTMRVLEKVIDQSLCLIVLADSSIKGFKDLSGKKVAIGAAGTGSVPMSRSVFKALGLTDKVKAVTIGYTQAAQSLKDRQIDAAIVIGGPYVAPAFTEIGYTTKLRLVEPTAEDFEKIEVEAPYLNLGVIPPNSAPGENSDKERKSLFFGLYWAALASMPDEFIYDLLKLTNDPKNVEFLSKVSSYWRSITPEFSVKTGVPIHAGAVKYWQERGIKLPQELIAK